VTELRNEIGKFSAEQSDTIADGSNVKWIAKFLLFAYFLCHANKLNISSQGNGKIILSVTEEILPFTSVIKL